jgi:hypothetical protein
MSSSPLRVVAACCAGLVVQSCASPPVPTGSELATTMGFTVSAPVAGGIPVRVVDASSGRTLADALVVSVEEADLSFCHSGPADASVDSLTVLRETGAAWLTGGDGTATIAVPDEPRVLLAWHGADFGRATLERYDHDEQVVRLQPISERSLTVEVVDPAGAPQPGVPIVLGHCSIELGTPGACHGVTGPEGRVVFSPVDLERSVHSTCGRLVQVLYDSPCCAYALRPIDATTIEPVRFVLPPCGELVVDLQDEHGAPFPSERLAQYRAHLDLGTRKIVSPHGTRRDSILEWPDYTREVDPCDVNSIHFTRVQLGTRLCLDAFGRGPSNSARDGTITTGQVRGETHIAGPMAPGETVHAILRLDEQVASEAAPDPAQAAREAEADAKERQKELQERKRLDDLSSIEVRAKLDVPIEACRLRARYRADSPDSDFLDKENDANWVDVQGRAVLRMVPAGTWTVAITLLGLETTEEFVLAEVPHVVVGARQHVRDPRLLSIDLSGKLRRRRIEVVDEKGAPQSGWIYCQRSNGIDRWWVRAEEGGRTLLTSASDDAPFFVAVLGHRPARIDDAKAVQRIVLKRGIPIRVLLDPKADVSKSGASRLFVGVPELPRLGALPDIAEESDTLRSVAIEPGGSARFWIPQTGEWRVLFLRTDDADERPESFSCCDASPATIHVEDSEAEQTFVVAPDVSASPKSD